MSSPLISIITPVYKAEAYLKCCIDSIVGQLDHDTELILIDDGSPYKCPMICDGYAEKYEQIKVIHQKNAGVSVARENGVARAKGKYIAFVDSDDWVEPDFISSMRDIIAAYSPDIICFGYYRVFGSKKVPRPIPMQGGLYSKKDIIRDIFPKLIEDRNGKSFPNLLGTKVFLRSLYISNQVQGCIIMMGEDAACVKPCVYHADSLFFDPAFYYDYRLTDGSVTASGKPLLWDGPVLIAEHYKAHIDLSQYDLSEQVSRNIIHNVFNVAVSQFSGERSYFETSGIIKKELKNRYFIDAVSSAHFSSFEGKICKLAVKYRLSGIFYLRWLQKYGRKKPCP